MRKEGPAGRARRGLRGKGAWRGPSPAHVSPQPRWPRSPGGAGPGPAGLGGTGRDLLSRGRRIPGLGVNGLCSPGRGAMAARPEPPQRARSPPGRAGRGVEQGAEHGAEHGSAVLARPAGETPWWDIPEQSPACWAQPPPFRGLGKGTNLLQDS